MKWFRLGVVEDYTHYPTGGESFAKDAIVLTVRKLFPSRFAAIAEIIQGNPRMVDFQYRHDFLLGRIIFAVGFKNDQHAVVYALKFPDECDIQRPLP